MCMLTLLLDTFFSARVSSQKHSKRKEFVRIFSIYLAFAGVLGIKVKIMLPWDPNNKNGPKRPLPDNVSILEPKDETHIAEELKAAKIDITAAAPVAQVVA